MKSALPALTAKVLGLRPHSSLACAAAFILLALSARPKMASNEPSAPAAMVIVCKQIGPGMLQQMQAACPGCGEEGIQVEEETNAGGMGPGQNRSERAPKVAKQCA